MDKDFGASERHPRHLSAVLLIPVVASSNPVGDTMKSLPRKQLVVVLEIHQRADGSRYMPKAVRQHKGDVEEVTPA